MYVCGLKWTVPISIEGSSFQAETWLNMVWGIDDSTVIERIFQASRTLMRHEVTRNMIGWHPILEHWGQSGVMSRLYKPKIYIQILIRGQLRSNSVCNYALNTMKHNTFGWK